MRVVVNALAVPSIRQGGAGFYVATLLDGLAQHDTELDVLASQRVADELAQVGVSADVVTCERSSRRKPSKALNGMRAVRKPLQVDVGFGGTAPPEHDHGDVVHYPISFMHAPAIHGARSALTVLDLQHEYFPDFFSRRDRLLRRMRWRPSAEAADHIIAISEYTKETICDLYEVEPSKVSVVPLTCRKVFWDGASGPPRSLPSGPGSDTPLFLYPASPLPAKNHTRLLEAFCVYCGRVEAGARLALTGPIMHSWGRVREDVARLGLEANVTVLEHVDDQELCRLYRAATGLIFPSLFEGFGLPVLEAMALGCPVASSTAGSLPELVGDAGRSFDPESEEEIADAFDWLGSLSSSERVAVGAAARKRADLFRPARMIDRTVSAYKTALS